MFLIITNESDITTDYVVLELQRRGHPYFRLNTERLASFDCVWHFDTAASRLEIRTPSRLAKMEEVSAAYFRRPNAPRLAELGLDEAAHEYCRKEWSALLRSLYSLLESRWLNSPAAIAAAEDKPLQLRAAIRVGLQVPATMLSNSAIAASTFAAERQSIVKPLSTAILNEGGDERVIFTSRLEPSPDFQEGSLRAAPIFFQEEIRKSFDVRVTVIGDRVFSASIDSQNFDETQVDWRYGSRPDLPHAAHELPPEISERCVALTRTLGLRFGAIDLVVDRNGAYWFLEINPNGQWAWIESKTGLRISSAIVDELENISQR